MTDTPEPRKAPSLPSGQQGEHEAKASARTGKQWPILSWLHDYQRAWLGPDLIAGVTLAAVAIPECMGYTKIAGTPVVTGLYTILFPIAAFALLGSSRHLVVGADSATAAILFSGLIGLAQPNSPEWLALASTTALLTAAFLVLACILRLGFLADFLSRTVLVGFLSGVGVSLFVGEVPDMLGVSVKGDGFVNQVIAIGRALPATHLPTLLMALAVLAVILGCGWLAPKVPGALLAVALAIAATWAFGLDRYGISVPGRVAAGLPALRIPTVPLTNIAHLVATSASMFLVIVAQSAATARSFAQKYNEPLDEDRDLVALGVANAVAGLSSTFVVNGSPTKTAVVDTAGSRTQLAQLTTAAVVLAVLLFATGLIARLPNAALAALVFLIGIRLVHVRALRQIYHFRKLTFAVSLGTLLGVVLLGVERGIFLAIGLSVLDHLRQEYHPKDVVLTETRGPGHTRRAAPGVETEPGLLIYRFEAPLFFANADYFQARLQQLITTAPHPVRWVVLDMVSMDDIDYTAGVMLQAFLARLQQGGITVACTHVEDVRAILDRLGITRQVGEAHLFPTPHAAIDAFHQATSGVERAADLMVTDPSGLKGDVVPVRVQEGPGPR